MPRVIAISSGHGMYIRGARGNPVPPQLDEVDEARKIVDRVAQLLGCVKFHDNTSHDQSTNLNAIVDWHNRQQRDLDVSVHFNAYDHSAHGTEVLYVTQQTLASDVSAAICNAGGFTNRGAKYRADLAFLNGTNEPAVLIETCFCDNTSDSNKYNGHFEAICQAIASSISGEAIADPEPPGERPPGGNRPPIEPPTQPPPDMETGRPVVGRGDSGPWVVSVQDSLGLPSDGEFGPVTEAGVVNFQRAWAVPGGADGIVGNNTWAALDELDAKMVNGSDGIPKRLANEIDEIVSRSPVLNYNWRDRGIAPEGYISGMAKTFSLALHRLDDDDDGSRLMAEAPDGDPDYDAMTWYEDIFSAKGMDNSQSGPDVLRHLFVMLIGLGMRESSGNHWEGRDMSATNVESDTCESGLFQSSWNLHTAADEIDALFNEFRADPNGFQPTFTEDQYPSTQDLDNYGSGNGCYYQWLAKFSPAFAVLMTGIGLRRRRQHWGPINRMEVEIVPMVNDLLQEVERATYRVPPAETGV